MAFAIALAFSAPVFSKDDIVVAGATLQVSALEASGSYDRFIVKFQEQGSSRETTVLRSNALASASRTASVTASSLRTLAVGGEVIALDRKLSADEAQKFMQALVAQGGVEYVEIDRIMQIAWTPNDPSYSQQWGFSNATAGIRANQAWDITRGAGVVVAVLDTGITSHPDLNANVLSGGYDFISSTSIAGDGNGRDSDPSDPGDFSGSSSSSWHGTHVAGTVAAVTNNGVGVAGTAPLAKILPVRVLGRGGGSTSDIADAIVWSSGGSVSGVPANANPAEVINLSLGGGGSCGSTFQNAINSAVSRGSVVVVAAGNDNVNVSNASPANCNNVIAVASTTSTGARSSFSNYGNLIDIAAPGSNIYSTLNSGSTTPGSPSYASYNGTSMAAPHVAGVVALIQSVASSPLSPAQVETLIKNTARSFPSTPSQTIGAGIVDAHAAVVAAGGGSSNTPPVANFSSSVNGLTVNFTDTSTDSDGNIASRSWSFGDGTTSTAANPSKTYASAGTYTVNLTVTDNQGASNSKSGSVTVSSGGGGGTVLSNGVPVTGISGAASSTHFWTIVVPAGATNLSIAMSGGTGDADLYVRRASAPTTSAYDCRPYLSGNNETCSFAAPVAGTYHVMMRGYSAYSGVSLVGSFTAGGGSTSFFQNTSDYAIADLQTVESPITVSGRSGNAPNNLKVDVRILHTYKGDLRVDVVSPSGAIFNLHNRTGGSTDNVIGTFTLNASGQPANGSWRLRVYDAARGDTGYIDSWSLQF